MNYMKKKQLKKTLETVIQSNTSSGIFLENLSTNYLLSEDEKKTLKDIITHLANINTFIVDLSNGLDQ